MARRDLFQTSILLSRQLSECTYFVCVCLCFHVHACVYTPSHPKEYVYTNTTTYAAILHGARNLAKCRKT